MPKVVVIAGPNGAGKSTTAARMLKDALKVEEFVNADTIAAGLSAFSPESVAVQAGRIMLERVHALAEGRRDFAFETTLASRTFARWLQELQTGDYVFHLIYLWLPSPEMALGRVEERVRKGGHSVDEATVRRRYERSLDNFFNLYSGFADSWVMLDNSVPRRPRVIARRGLNRAPRIINSQQWNVLRAKYERQSTNTI